MLRKLTFRLAIFLLILWVIPAYAQLPQYQNFCQTGGQQVNTQGLLSSTRVQASYPSCTVTVRNAGTSTISTIFSTAGGGALGNPFTANVDGSFLFFAASSPCYDVTISGGTPPNAMPAPFTFSNVCLSGGGGGGGGVSIVNGTANQINVVNPATTPTLSIANPFTFPGPYRQTGSLSGTVTVQPQATAGTWTWQWPNSPGAAGQCLSTDGTGLTNWAVCSGGSGSPGGAPTQIQFNNAGNFGGIPNVIPGSSLVSQGTGTTPTFQTKAIYDTRDWMTCDGNGTTGTDASSGMNALLAAIGTTEATIRFTGSTTNSATCRIGNIFFGSNITLDFSGGGAIQLISSSTPIGSGSYVSGTSVECGAGITCALPAFSVSAGNTIVVAEAPYPGFTFRTTKVTDTCGNFYIHAFQSLANQPRNQGAWIASNVNGGTCTITATANGSLTTHMMLAAQVSGMGPVTSLNASASNNNTGLTMSSGSVTTLTGAFLLAFGGQPFTAETCTAGAGYTQPPGLAGQSATGAICAEYLNASAGGSTSATQTISVNPSPATWVYSLIALKPGNATATIWGGIIDPDQHQILYNADSGTGHGVVDFTGSGITQDVCPEWWGAGTNATAAVNTPAIQAAFWAAFGGGLTQPRTNASLLSVYNRPLRIGGLYSINDEIKMYDVLGFRIYGVNRLSSGFVQTASNKRIIDGQSDAYGQFADITFTSSASSTLPQVDLDYNGVATPGDLRPQFIDFDRVNFVGNGLAAQGLLLAKSGGGAQGSNIYCRDCAAQNFTVAAWQIGTATAIATNALAIGFSGDIQGCPFAGILSYGGGYISFGDGVEESSMENGFSTQTGFDMYCVATQGPCSMDYMRSESRRLISGNDIVLHKSRMINQASLLPPGTTFPVGSLMTGTAVGGDGAFYSVTNNGGPAGGIGTVASPLRASSGTTTTLVDTNQTIAGSVTLGKFGTVSSEVVTQAVTGSTGTVLTAPTSIGTVTGTLTSGLFTGLETITQAVTGVTAVLQFPTPNNSGPVPLTANNFSGTADNTHIWTGGTSGATWTPSSAPVFSVSNPPMLITAATGVPDNSHNWVGSSGAVYVPTGLPINQAAFTVNAFTGMFVSILTGKSAGCYGVVTSNTATDITFTAGWTTRYFKLGCPAPDTSSAFVVEPGWNHGTVTSGGMTMVYQNENAIDCQNPIGTSNCAPTGRLEDVIIAGGKVNLSASMVIDNLLVYRQDWYGSIQGNPQSCCDMLSNWDVRVVSTVGPTNIPYQGAFYQSWTLPSTTGVSYTGSLQQRLGTKALVWDVGNVNEGNPPGNTSANSVWIGGRTDNGAGVDATRNILEFGGMLGRGAPLPSTANGFNTTDQAGAETPITGGPSTGTGLGGPVCFYTSNATGSSATVNSGLKRWCVSAVGHWLAQLDNTYDIGAAGATRPRRVYVGTDFVGPIGATTPSTGSFTTLTVGSGTAVALIKFATDTPGAITVNAGTCTDRGVAIAGSSTTATIQISAAYALDANILVSPAQAVAGTAHYRICNPTGGNITLNAAAAFNISVMQ